MSGTLGQKDTAGAVLDDCTDNANQTAGSHGLDRRSKRYFRRGVMRLVARFPKVHSRTIAVTGGAGDSCGPRCNFSRMKWVVHVMKMFLKVVLLAIVAIIVVKSLPLLVAAGFALAGALLGFIALAASAIAALIGSALVLAVLLSPIWIPILALIGLITLIKRGGRKNGGVAA